jgi:FAD/FMN-containing dehydrogenase
VPRAELTAFLADAARELRRHRADVIYGTVRLIERDLESFLAWAREPWACVVVNLHVQHDALSRARADATFRALFDLALGRGGSFYLTYGRHATAAQLDAAHPRLREMLRQKDARDPRGVFRSTWWQWMRAALG